MFLSPHVSMRTAANRKVAAIPMLFLAAAVALAACSSNPTVEATDTTGPDTSVVESTDTTDGDGGSEELLVEGEESAMGEDDDDTTTTTAPDDAGADTTAGPDLGSADLEAALIAGQAEDLKLPFLYITADQDCQGCAETVSLYYVPGPEKASDLVFSSAFVSGAAVELGAVDSTLSDGDPRLVAERLAEADAAGTLDNFSIDPVSGLVTSWTIDGDTVTLRCLQVDTRPIDLRSEVCRDSLIG